jgi:hypothetical protein
MERLIKGYIGVGTKVRVVKPGTVQLSPGKAIRAVDRRPKA